jgi:hypothetical protein
MEVNLIQHLRIINQVFDIEKKSSTQNAILRHTERIYIAFDEIGFRVQNPQGERYFETRTDCEASIVGPSIENLVVTDVIKPIIHFKDRIVQKGIVIVEGH